MNKKQKRNTQTGITLIALVITIIILLILAVVSIRLVMNSGIITRAEKATTTYSVEETEEQRKIKEAEYEAEKYANVKTELTEEEATAAGWKYSGEYITGYTGTDTEIYIPSKIGQTQITNLSSLLFRNADNISKIVVPSTITIFADMCGQNVETVILREGISELMAYSVRGSDKLEYLILPSTLKTIKNYALANTSIKNIVIPKSVKDVEIGIFGWCKYPITIHCEAESKPEGWSDDWLKYAPEGTTVDWGYKAK